MKLQTASSDIQEEDTMKSSPCIAILAILNAMLLCFSDSSVQAGESKGGARSGGQASSHMSSKGVENTNAQWSADPDRGWVRADERHDLHDQGQSVGKSNQSRGKNKGHGSKGKAVKESTK